MSMTPAFDLSAEDLAALPLKEFAKMVARRRIAAGLPAIDRGENMEIRESDQDVRESASLSDLPTIMGNNIYRVLDNWFSEYKGTWQQYAHQVDLIDYRLKQIAFVSEMEDALPIYQESDYKESGLMDKGYGIQLKKYGRQVTLPFMVIENDDKGFVASIPQKMARAADRTIQKIVVRNTLEANPNGYDGTPIFSPTHTNALFGGLTGNLVTGGGSAFSTANLQAGVAAVQSFTGDPDLNPSGVPLDIPAEFLVVPPSLEFQAAQALNSIVLIAAGTANPIVTQGASNPLQMRGFQTPLTLLVERYLTNPTAYYLLPAKEHGPITVGVRQQRPLRPHMWRSIPMRTGVGGAGADGYQMSIDDITFGFSTDLAAVGAKYWSCMKFAGA